MLYINVYLAPLIEELQKLWEGVDVVDVSDDSENRNFVLKAILMWCIHDYPTYGLLLRQVTKGYRRCSECGPNITTRQSAILEKNLYLGHWRYLKRSHLYQRQRRAFDGTKETRGPQCPLIWRDIMRHGNARTRWLHASKENNTKGNNDLVHLTGVKRFLVLYNLPYW